MCTPCNNAIWLCFQDSELKLYDFAYNRVIVVRSMFKTSSVQFLNGTPAQKGYLVPFTVYMMDRIWK